MKFALGITALAVGVLFAANAAYEWTTLEDETTSSPPITPPSATTVAAPVFVQHATAAPKKLSQSAIVKGLMASPRAIDALAAYKILAACAQAREERQDDAICEDISQGQLASRRQPLHRAASVGVHGAALLLVSLGPDDYGLHGIDAGDPVFKDWQQHVNRALEAGVRTGDRFSLISMAQLSEMPTDGTAPNPALALMYWTAVSEQTRSAAYAKEVERRASALPPDRADSAIAAGKRLALAFKPEGEQQ